MTLKHALGDVVPEGAVCLSSESALSHIPRIIIVYANVSDTKYP